MKPIALRYRVSPTWVAIVMIGMLPTAPVRADTCADLAAMIAKSNTLNDLRMASRTFKGRENDLRACESALRQNTKLQQLMNAEKQQVTAKKQSRLAQLQRQIKAPEQLASNSRVLQLRSEAKNRLASVTRLPPPSKLQTGTIQPHSTNSTNPTPPRPAKINLVTPSTLVPGTDVVIEGEHFGSLKGNVVLKTQGKLFTATINAWTDTFINAFLPSDIGGVMPSDNAVISLQIPGATIDRNIPFLPLYVQKSGHEEYLSPGSLIFPGSGTTTVFQGKELHAGWQITSVTVTVVDDYGNCRFGTPHARVAHSQLESQLKWSFDWWQGFANCNIDVHAEGPQGIASGLE